MYKKKLFIWGILIFIIGYTFVMGLAGKAVLEGIYDNRPDKFQKGYGWVYRLGGRWIPLINKLPELLDDKTYIVLLQNNTELRPTGGFMGSYARVKFIRGGMTEMLVKDIYDPDGQLKGHVEPPLPIQEAFGQGWWRLRDSNWDPDFASAAATINWFFEKGKEAKADGLVAINMGLVQKWIREIGGVNPMTREERINADNFYSIAQKSAEYNWYPGSTQKRDFLGAVGTALVEKTKTESVIKKFMVIKLFWDELINKQILVWMREPSIQKEIEKIGWSGKLEQPRLNEDYLYIVESNLGANKANCCIQRNIHQTISEKYGSILVKWKNENKVSTPDKINNWGGDYVDYVRIITRKNSKIVRIKVDDKILRFEIEKSATPSSLIQKKDLDVYRVEEKGDLQIIGFWVITKALSESKVEIEYEAAKKYKEIMVKRQPGIESFPYKLIVKGRTRFDGIIVKDKEIKF